MKKLTIGLLVDDSDNVFTTEIWRGASYAATTIDANLIVFFGGFVGNLKKDIFSRYEYQKNSTYLFSQSSNVDLLIISVSSIVQGDYEAKKAFVEQFSAKAIVTLNHQFNDNGVVTFNNQMGIEEAVSYLIEKQNCQEIGMIAGPEFNRGSDERLEAYFQTLKKHGIAIDMKKVIHTPSFSQGHLEIARQLLSLNPHLQAIICASDTIAFDAYKVCQEYDLVVGEDILIVGFDDVQEASKVNPPLATIRAEAAQLGYYAVIDGVRSLRGEIESAFKTLVDVNFIKRDSLGKANQVEELLFSQILEEISQDAMINKLNEYIFSNNHSIFIKNIKQGVKELIKYLVTLKNSNLYRESIYQQFSLRLKTIFDLETIKFFDLKRLLQVIQLVGDYLSKSKDINEVIYFIQKTNHALSLHVNSLLSENLLKTKDKEHLINILSRNIMGVHSEQDNYQTIFKCLKQLGINNAKLYLYDQPMSLYSNQVFCLPDQMIFKGAIIDGAIDIPQTKQSVATEMIFDQATLFTDSNEYVVNTIYSGATQYGIFLCDLKYYEYLNIEFVSSQLGAVINTFNLVSKLDDLSKHDDLTGLYNRRGFIDMVQIKRPSKHGQLLFVDMDQLKKINDTYGHINGDLAIIKGATILNDIFGDKGIVGRIGGDEFAVFLSDFEAMSIDKIDELISWRTAYYNALKDLDFEVQLSYGITNYDCDDNLLINDLLKQADHKMYIHKRKKKEDK